MPDDELAGIRKKLDAIDTKIVELLAERMGLSKEVGRVKQKDQRSEFMDPAREAEVVRRLKALAGDSSLESLIERIYREIMAESLSRQQPQTISFLGPLGTFSHEAALDRFGACARLSPEHAISACFEAVEDQKADYAIVPYENSTEGGVGETLDCLVATRLTVCGEEQLRVRQNLLAQPGVGVPDIAKVYSHPQSFAQCRRWLEANLPSCERIDCSSNSIAARKAEEAGAGFAAIGPQGAATGRALEVLVWDIEDNPRNVTRFLILGRRQIAASGDDKTTLTFTTKDRPGALYHLLKLFADAGVNMTRLESRPVPGEELGSYMFFIDVLGHRDEEPLNGTLALLAEESRSLKVLGSYPVSAPAG